MGTRQPVHKALLARIEKSGPVRDTESVKRQTNEVPAADPRGLKRQVSLPQNGEYRLFHKLEGCTLSKATFCKDLLVLHMSKFGVVTGVALGSPVS